MARLLYAINHLQLNHEDQPLFDHAGIDTGKFGFFDAFFNQVHIDEKWFFVCQETLRLYLTEGEVPPIRRVGHKSHIEKVMFCALLPAQGGTKRVTVPSMARLECGHLWNKWLHSEAQ
jgi:hypothetical protein